MNDISYEQEAHVLRREISNGPPLFPPPNNDPDNLFLRFRRRDSRSKRRITCVNLLKFFIRNQTSPHSKYVISKVAGEMWRDATQHNKEAYNNLCNQINLRNNH